MHNANQERGVFHAKETVQNSASTAYVILSLALVWSATSERNFRGVAKIVKMELGAVAVLASASVRLNILAILQMARVRN